MSPVVCERLSVTSRILRNISLRLAAMVLMAPPSSEISLRPRIGSVWVRSPDAIFSAAPFISSSGRITSRLVAAMPSSRASTTAATLTETRATRALRCTAATCSRVSFISPPTVTSRSSIAVSTLPLAARMSSRIRAFSRRSLERRLRGGAALVRLRRLEKFGLQGDQPAGGAFEIGPDRLHGVDLLFELAARRRGLDADLGVALEQQVHVPPEAVPHHLVVVPGELEVLELPEGHRGLEEVDPGLLHGDLHQDRHLLLGGAGAHHLLNGAADQRDLADAEHAGGGDDERPSPGTGR